MARAARRLLDTFGVACVALVCFVVAVYLTARYLVFDFAAQARRIWSE